MVPRGNGGGRAAVGALVLIRGVGDPVVIGVCGEARHQDGSRRLAGRGAIQIKSFKRWQSAAFERSGEGGAAGVGDLGEAE